MTDDHTIDAALSDAWCIVANVRADAANRLFRPGARMVLVAGTSGGAIAFDRGIFSGLAGARQKVSAYLAFKHLHNWRVQWAKPTDRDEGMVFETEAGARDFFVRMIEPRIGQPLSSEQESDHG